MEEMGKRRKKVQIKGGFKKPPLALAASAWPAS
jgi:hypothetical protein